MDVEPLLRVRLHDAAAVGQPGRVTTGLADTRRDNDTIGGLSAAGSNLSVSVDEIRDSAAVNTGVGLIEQDAVRLESLPMRVRRVIARFAGAAVMFHSTHVRLRTHTRLHEDAIAFVTFGSGASGTVNGLAIRPGLLLAVGPGVEIGFVAEAGWESVTFVVPSGATGAHLAVRGLDAGARFPDGVATLQGEPERILALFHWGRRLTEVAAGVPDRLRAGSAGSRVVLDEMLDVLLAALVDTRDLESHRSDRTAQAYSRIVRVAEEHALSHIGERIYVRDLCRVAAVSERTLEVAFKSVVGMLPVAYLNWLRLHLVRRTLLAAAPGFTTVAAIALDGGFRHMGEFAGAYKACFGERPSDTLRRAGESG